MKSLSMYRPADSVSTLVDINRLVDSFFGSNGRYDIAHFGKYPVVDVKEEGNNYVIEAELPGYDEKDIEVNLNGGTLTIESKKETETEKKDEKGNYVIKERRSSAFSRSFKLPDDADAASVEAGFKNGLLTLHIKKRTEAQKKVIEIKTKE